MAEPLKNQFGPAVPRRIAEMIAQVDADFDSKAFLDSALRGYEALELMPRGRHIAAALRQHLPDDYEAAIEVLLASLGPVRDADESHGMAPFLYLPHVYFVAENGLDHFEASMRAQYELTQRFTAEFSIRPFIERDAPRTLARLREWASDASPHVRRLVSEGTRPRLPWAPRLREFQHNPEPVLELLELLKDDPSLYVRRSVANNLNDIGKDHPDLLNDTARRWLVGASPERRWLINHALRSAIKRGEVDALDVLGYAPGEDLTAEKLSVTPAVVRIGDQIEIAFDLVNRSTRAQRALVDIQVHFIKANGRASPKVFKIKQVELAPSERLRLSKQLSLRPMTTRKHYPGQHRIDALINGENQPLGSFLLKPN